MSKIAELYYISLVALDSHKIAESWTILGKPFMQPWNIIEQWWLASKRTGNEHKKWQEPEKIMRIHWGYMETTV